MACLNLAPGDLLPPGPVWQNGTAPVTTPAGVTITHTPAGAAPGIVIERGGASLSIAKPPKGDLHFMTFGSPANYILVLINSDTTAGSSSIRTVALIDTTGTSLRIENVFNLLAVDATLPGVLPSQGSGSIFLVKGANGGGPTASTWASIHRSDNGDTLCSAVSFIPTGEVTGEITATALLIKNGGAVVSSCARPVAECQVTPDPDTFPDAVLGAADPALAVRQRTFTVRNTGHDCLSISSITSAGPYSVTASTPALPTVLDPGRTMTVTVRYAPTAPGTHNHDLPIVPTPPAGDRALRCRGTARTATRRLTFGGSLGFGAVPVGGSRTSPLTLTSSGEAAVAVGLSAGTDGDFSWTDGSGPLAPGATRTVSVTFAPGAEGSRTGSIAFTSDATGSPHRVDLAGTGCVPRALIQVQVPAGPAIDLGAVQREFRMMRIIRVRNAGNGPLNFRATVSGSPLWGLQDAGGSPLSPSVTRDFTVAPVTPCGPGAAGSGELAFAVTFHAHAAPGTVTGRLVIDNHNAGAGAPATFEYPLQATIIPGVAVDVELVLDRSGSMADPSGSRTKMVTAIEAARLFVQLARVDVDDRLGLVRFSTTPDVLSPIAPLTPASQAALAGTIDPATLAPSGSTCIAGGVMEALRDMADHPRATPPAELNRAVLVLTDGMDNEPYTNPADGVRYSLLGGDGTTALTVPAGVRLYAVGIGDSIDVGRLGQLAQATSGQFLPVREATGSRYFEMEKHFTQVYMDAVNLATLLDPVYTIHAGERQTIAFDVLRGDVSTMVVIYDREGVRLPFWLRTPTGETVGLGSIPPGFQVRPGITDTARFLEVRMPLGEPGRYAGTWQAVVEHDGYLCTTSADQFDGQSNYGAGYDLGQFGPGFRPRQCPPSDRAAQYGIALGVGSNFRMAAFVDPGIVRVGEPIRLNALVSEYGLPVTGCTVTVTAVSPDGSERTLTLRDDGTHHDGEADDGDYGASFTHTHAEGSYLFTFRATGHTRDGEPVYREAVRGKYVQGRIPLVPDTVPGVAGGRDECCGRVLPWLWIGCILLLLILIVLLLLLWR